MITTKAEFLANIAKPESVEALNRMLSSSLFRNTITYAMGLGKVYYSNQSRFSKIPKILFYSGLCFASGIVWFGMSSITYLAYNLPQAPFAMPFLSRFRTVIWRGFETGPLWGIAKVELRNRFLNEKNLQLFEMLSFLGEAIIDKETQGKQLGLLQLLDDLECAGDIDTALDTITFNQVENREKKGDKAGTNPVSFKKEALESLLSTVRKISENVKFKDIITIILKKEQIVAIISNYLKQNMTTDSAIKDLKDYVSEIIEVVREENKQVFTLLSTSLDIISAKDLDALILEIQKGEAQGEEIPVGQVLAAFPILVQMLCNKEFRKNIAVLISNKKLIKANLEYYEKQLKGGKEEIGKEAQEKFANTQAAIIGITANVELINQLLELCSSIASLIATDDIKSIIEAYNDPETKAFLIEARKKEGDTKDPDAPALPSKLILASFPILQRVLNNEKIRNLFVTILPNQTLIDAMALYLPEKLRKPVSEIMQDVKLVGQILESCVILIKDLISVDNLSPILEAYNDHETQDFLKNPKSFQVPSKLVMAVFSLVQSTLANETVRNLLVHLLTNEKILNLIELYFPEDLKEQIKDLIKDKKTLAEILYLVDIALAELKPEDVVPLLTELLRPKEEGGHQQTEVEKRAKDEEFLAKIIETSAPVLHKLLQLPKFQYRLGALLSNKLVLNIITSSYRTSLTKKVLKEIEQQHSDIAYDREKAIELPPEAEGVIDVAVRDLEETIAILVSKKSVIDDALNLTKTMFDVIYVKDESFEQIQAEFIALQKELVKEASKDEAIPVNLMLSLIPILQKEFANEQFRSALENLVRNNAMDPGVAFYSKLLCKNKKEGELQKAQEMVSKTEEVLKIILKNESLLKSVIELCGTLINSISVDNIKPILEAYNDPETKFFLAELLKKEDEAKNLDAPIIPVKLIKAMLPLIKAILPNAIPAIQVVILNKGVEEIVKSLYGDESRVYRNFIWARDNIGDILQLTCDLIPDDQENLGTFIEGLNKYLTIRNKYLIEHPEEGVELKNLATNFINANLVAVSKDTTGILQTIQENASVIAKLVNSHPDYDEFIPVKFGNLNEIITNIIPVAQHVATQPMQPTISMMLDILHKSSATSKMRSSIKAYIKGLNKEGAKKEALQATLKDKLINIIKANKDRIYFSELREALLKGEDNIPILQNVAIPETFNFPELEELLSSVAKEVKEPRLKEGSFVIVPCNQKDITQEIKGMELEDLIAVVLGTEYGKTFMNSVLLGISAPTPITPKQIRKGADFKTEQKARDEQKEQKAKELAERKHTAGIIQAAIDVVKALVDSAKEVNELVEPLLRSIKLFRKLDAVKQFKEQGDEDKLATQCELAFNNFFQILDPMLVAKQQKLLECSGAIADILFSVIPEEKIKDMKGYTVNYLVLLLLNNHQIIKDIVPPAINDFVIKSTWVNGVGNIITTIFTNYKSLVAGQAISVAGSLVGSLLGLTRYTSDNLNEFLQHCNETQQFTTWFNPLSKDDQFRVKHGTFCSTTYEWLNFHNLHLIDIADITFNFPKKINISNSSIRYLDIMDCTIESMNLSHCSITDTLNIRDSNLKNFNFDNIKTLKNLTIEETTLDAKSFISLMRVIYDKRFVKVELKSLEVKGNLCANGATYDELKQWFIHIPAINAVKNGDPVFNRLRERTGNQIIPEKHQTVASKTPTKSIALLDREILKGIATSYVKTAGYNHNQSIIIGFITDWLDDYICQASGITQQDKLQALSTNASFIGTQGGWSSSSTGLCTIIDKSLGYEAGNLQQEFFQLVKQHIGKTNNGENKRI
jgi:hypothetical protein